MNSIAGVRKDGRDFRDPWGLHLEWTTAPLQGFYGFRRDADPGRLVGFHNWRNDNTNKMHVTR